MPKKKKKESFDLIRKLNEIDINEVIRKLNEIDVNQVIENLNKINLEDIKDIDFKKLLDKCKKSKALKVSLGMTCSFILFIYLLIPNVKRLSKLQTKSNIYREELLNLPSLKDKLKVSRAQIEQIALEMETIEKSFLSKDKSIFVSKLVNDTAIKADVEVLSFLPAEDSQIESKCSIKNSQGIKVKKKGKNKSATRRVKKGRLSLITNNYELSLSGNYLNIVEFIKIIQYFDVTISPRCFTVRKDNTRVNRNTKSLNNSSGLVKAEIVLTIPAHSR